jgi:hypothetical protein
MLANPGDYFLPGCTWRYGYFNFSLERTDGGAGTKIAIKQCASSNDDERCKQSFST